MQTPSRSARCLRYRQQVLPDGPAAIAQLPGTRGFGPLHTALFQAVRTIDAGNVFVVGPGAAATALWAHRAGAAVTTWQDSIAEDLAIEATFQLNHCTVPTRYVQWDPAVLSPGWAELALLHLPRGRALQAHLLQLAGAMLAPSGRLIFVGATKEGVKGAIANATQLFGAAGVVARKGGYHAAVAYRPASSIPLPAITFSSRKIEVDGQVTRLISCRGVFAHNRLDSGAAALIAGMRVEPGSRGLDMGCGTGLVGLAALRRGARVIGTDVSARAVTSARRTWNANGFPESSVKLCVGANAVSAGTMEFVIANPPFHRGHDVHLEVAQLFIREAARVLQTGGELYLVANAFLDYRPWLAEHFRIVSIAREDRRFRVWHAC